MKKLQYGFKDNYSPLECMTNKELMFWEMYFEHMLITKPISYAVIQTLTTLWEMHDRRSQHKCLADQGDNNG